MPMRKKANIWNSFFLSSFQNIRASIIASRRPTIPSTPIYSQILLFKATFKSRHAKKQLWLQLAIARHSELNSISESHRYRIGRGRDGERESGENWLARLHILVQWVCIKPASLNLHCLFLPSRKNKEFLNFARPFFKGLIHKIKQTGTTTKG